MEKTLEPTLPSLAKAIAEHFPELEGRAIAVSDLGQFEETPTNLPIAVVALAGEEGTQSPNGGGSISLTDTFAVLFVFEPEKYETKSNDGMFWAYYDYEAVRDKLLAMTHDWRTPRGGSISYKSLEINTDPRSVDMLFTFTSQLKWCNPEPQEGHKVDIISKLVHPQGLCPNAECCDTDNDPCADALQQV